MGWFKSDRQRKKVMAELTQEETPVGTAFQVESRQGNANIAVHRGETYVALWPKNKSIGIKTVESASDHRILLMKKKEGGPV